MSNVVASEEAAHLGEDAIKGPLPPAVPSRKVLPRSCLSKPQLSNFSFKPTGMDPLSILAVMAAAVQFADIGSRLLTHFWDDGSGKAESELSQLHSFRLAAKSLTRGIGAIADAMIVEKSSAAIY